jgi:hypothetical protein
MIDLDPNDISLALLRHHLLQPPMGVTPRVISKREGTTWAIVLVTHNETDPDTPLVIAHGNDGRLVSRLLPQLLAVNRRYLFIIPLQLRPMLRGLLRDVEYGRQCLLYSCHGLALDRPIKNVFKVNGPGENYAYRKLSNGKQAAEASVNWQGDTFAEVGVYTRKEFRGRGFAKDVVFCLTREVLQSGRWPLYVVSRHNRASIAVCEALGYQFSGHSEFEAVGRYSQPALTQRLRQST